MTRYYGRCPRCDQALAKRDGDHFWLVDCFDCGKPMVTTLSAEEAGVYSHSGCAGWPYCMCTAAHKGPCPGEVTDLPTCPPIEEIDQ